MSIRLSDLWGGIFFLLLSVLFWLQLNNAAFEDVEIANNPVWYPQILLICSGLASIILILRSFTGKKEKLPKPNYLKMLIVAIVLAVYFLIFEQVGFIPASIILFPILSWILGYRNIVVISSVSVIFVISIWYLFAEVFSVRPPGIGMDQLINLFMGA